MSKDVNVESVNIWNFELKSLHESVVVRLCHFTALFGVTWGEVRKFKPSRDLPAGK